MKAFLIRGVPQNIQNDAWWMTAEAPQLDVTKPVQTKETSQGAWQSFALLVALIALGDVLIWDVVPGLSLAVFLLGIGAASLGLFAQRLRRPMWQPAAVLVASVIPLIEVVQPLTVMIALVGMMIFAALTVTRDWADVARATLRFPLVAIVLNVEGAAQGVAAVKMPAQMGGSLGRLMRNWALPVVMAVVFALLFAAANPVLDRWLGSVFDVRVSLDMARICFWVILAAAVWPFLSVYRGAERMKRTRATVRKRSWVDHVMNETSVRNALVMFNVMFALQTGLDLAILSGGAALPEGMSYASYAHRGAYPLVVTALLAGVFAILAQSYLNGPVMRALMIGWVAQNVALVASSMLRLDLYVDVYGLTHMRFAAFVWMGLVAVGLALMIWQLWRGLTARWLFAINGLVLAAVLYGMCFVNVSGIVARDQLARTDEFVWYVCELGEGALPAIYQAERFEYLSECYDWGTLSRSVPSDWREWGFRNARIAAYLERNLEGAQG